MEHLQNVLRKAVDDDQYFFSRLWQLEELAASSGY